MESICTCGRITESYIFGEGLKLRQNGSGQWFIGCNDCWRETHEMIMDSEFKYCPWCGGLLPKNEVL
jgi:rRNA maturation endonuclease Nob1